MPTLPHGARIAAALKLANISQRELQNRTGISQATLSRVVSGHRAAKIPELIQIADATGVTVAFLTGSDASERVQFAARATNGSAMEQMHEQLLHFIELDAYLDDQAIFASI